MISNGWMPHRKGLREELYNRLVESRVLNGLDIGTALAAISSEMHVGRRQAYNYLHYLEGKGWIRIPESRIVMVKKT